MGRLAGERLALDVLAASKAQGTQAGGEARLPWVSEHPNSPKTSGLLMAATHPGWQREREEFLHSEMTEMQAKGISFPQGGKCSESSGVGSDTAFWGVPSPAAGDGCSILGSKLLLKD